MRRRPPRLILLLASGLAACDGDMAASLQPDLLPSGEPTAAATTALHYDVTLDLATSSATSRVTLRVDAEGSCASIGFRPPEVTAVTLDGEAVSGSDLAVDAAAHTLTACRPGHRPWSTGQLVTLSATAPVPRSTLGLSQVGYSTRKDAAGKPFTYLLSWVNGCDRHGPCDARPDRFATYRFTVLHDAATMVLCPGAITPSAQETTCDFASEGGPTYSTFGVAAGQSWSASPLGTWSGVDVKLFDYPVTQTAARFDAAMGAGHMAWLQGLLGPYPYGSELRFVVAPTYWLGFEHPGNIVISENLARAGGQLGWTDALRHVTMHELTHQWAGDHTTLAGTYDFTWKESMAEYLTFVFEDEHIAAADGRATLEMWKQGAAASRHFAVPTDGPELFVYYSDAYGEGPMILFRQLEVMYSRKAVLDALHAVLGGPARALSIDDLRVALEATTGAHLGGYFAGWVRGSGAPAWPTAKVKTTDQGGGAVEVAVTVRTADGVPRGCAFKVRLGDGGGKTFDVPVNLGPDGALFAPVVVRPGFAVAQTEVDPDDECIISKDTGALAPARLPPNQTWVDARFRE